MKANVLVNLFDIHNEASLLAIEKVKPFKVIYLVDEEMQEMYDIFREYVIKKFHNIKFEKCIVKIGDIDKINNILKDQSIDECAINITGGKRINSLILLNMSLIKGFKIIYIDVLNKEWYDFGKHIKKIEDEFEDINLQDMVNITGANIIMDSTKLSEKKEIIDITKSIYKNLDKWYKYKHKLYDGNIFIHDYSNNNKIKIILNNLKYDELEILKKTLEYLSNIECIEYKYYGNEIQVDFLKQYIKGFIFKSGTWLEVLTNIVIREINEIDEVKSGVVFLWNEGKKNVRNELDVLAVKDSILICISCKDSEKYDENALNELDVYSKRLGGCAAKKILVATKSPCKQCVCERAKAMGINLVILDNNISKFREKLKKIIIG